DAVDSLDQDLLLRRVGLDDLALGALVLAGDDQHRVALVDLHVYSTSGASETMRMNRLSRSSRPTGPKMRVPRGSLSFLMMTAAFSSNLMYEPSGRRRSLAVRTMTALTISPFLTFAPGIASFTVATTTSPTPAQRRLEPPSTRMHRICLAPELSATLSRASCWIMVLLTRSFQCVPDSDPTHAVMPPGCGVDDTGSSGNWSSVGLRLVRAQIAR